MNNNAQSKNGDAFPTIANNNNQILKKIVTIQKFKEKAMQLDRFDNLSSSLTKQRKESPSRFQKDSHIFPSIPLKKLLKSQVVELINENDGQSTIKKVGKINDTFYKRLLGLRESNAIQQENQSEIKETKSFYTSQEKNINKKNQINPIKISSSPTQSNSPLRYSSDITMNNNLRNSVPTTKNVINLRPIRIVAQSPNNNIPQTIPEKVANEKSMVNSVENSPKKQEKKKLPPLIQKPKKELLNSYCVLPGNNSRLIIACMKTRPKWEQCEKSISSFANLLWAPLSKDINFIKNENCSCQYVNHLEYHSEISNKMKLFSNLIKYCEANSIDLFSFFPLTIIFHLSHKSFPNQLKGFETYYNELPSNQVNDNVYKNYFDVNCSKKIGTTQKMTLPSTMYTGKNLWLIKPVNLNRGRCIKVLSGIDNIVNEMKILRNSRNFDSNDNEKNNGEGQKQKKSQTEFVLLQKYIEKPLLYQKRKFDIRMWILYTDKEELFAFKEGHLKATCDRYDVNSMDPYVHLTNYSVQKHNLNFSKTEIGNEISFEDFQKELDKTTNPPINFKKDILPKIYNIIRITLNSVKTKLNFFGRKNSFEIFGYDFLIDSEFNPFLIEINTNPGFEESSPLIKMLVPRMIDDALRLTIDVGYPRKNENGNDPYVNVSPFEVTGYSNRENMWQRLRK